MQPSRPAAALAGRGRVGALVALVLLGPVLALSGTAANVNEPCDVRPRTFGEIERLLTAPAGAATAPATVVRPHIDAPTASEILTLLHQFLACSGSGEPLRVWSLYSDAYLARLLSRERGYDQARYALDAQPRPRLPDQWPTLSEVSEPVLDERGLAVVTTTIWYPNIAREKRLLFTLVWIGDDLRIEEVDGEITFAVP